MPGNLFINAQINYTRLSKKDILYSDAKYYALYFKNNVERKIWGNYFVRNKIIKVWYRLSLLFGLKGEILAYIRNFLQTHKMIKNYWNQVNFSA